MESKVSIVIPTYKRSWKIKEAIESVLEQSFINWELLIVDDNGTGTADQMKTQKIVNMFNDRRINYLRHKKNKGGCEARNTGIRASKGELIAFLDDDDKWMKQYLEIMLKMFKDNKNYGLVYSSSYTSKNGLIYKKKDDNIKITGNVYNELAKGWCPESTTQVMVRKKVFDEVGCFDSNLASFQDYDMWLRISKKTEFGFVDKPLMIKYEHDGDQVSLNPITRKNGFDTLFEKITDDLHIHYGSENTNKLKNIFLAKIYYNEIIMYRNDFDLRHSVKSLRKLMLIGNNNLKAKGVFICLFGAKALNNLCNNMLKHNLRKEMSFHKSKI